MDKDTKLDMLMQFAGAFCAGAVALGWYGVATLEFIIVLSAFCDRIVNAIRESK